MHDKVSHTAYSPSLPYCPQSKPRVVEHLSQRRTAPRIVANVPNHPFVLQLAQLDVEPHFSYIPIRTSSSAESYSDGHRIASAASDIDPLISPLVFDFVVDVPLLLPWLVVVAY